MMLGDERKPSYQYRAWHRLHERFKLRLGGGWRAWLSSVVVPITNMDSLLQDFEVLNETKTGISTGSVEALAVPVGKRWYVLGFYMSRSGGDRNVGNPWVHDREGNTFPFYYDSGAPSSEVRTGLLAQPVPMEEGWLIKATVSGGSSDSNWQVKVLYISEDAY